MVWRVTVFLAGVAGTAVGAGIESGEAVVVGLLVTGVGAWQIYRRWTGA